MLIRNTGDWESHGSCHSGDRLVVDVWLSLTRDTFYKAFKALTPPQPTSSSRLGEIQELPPMRWRYPNINHLQSSLIIPTIIPTLMTTLPPTTHNPMLSWIIYIAVHKSHATWVWFNDFSASPGWHFKVAESNSTVTKRAFESHSFLRRIKVELVLCTLVKTVTVCSIRNYGIPKVPYRSSTKQRYHTKSTHNYIWSI